MDEPSDEMNALASRVVGAAIEVHRVLGRGFFESVYARSLEYELAQRHIPFARQPSIGVVYKTYPVGVMRPDLVVANRLIVELKAVDRLDNVHLAQALSYLKATHFHLALVINFNVPVLLRGVRRVVLAPPIQI